MIDIKTAVLEEIELKQENKLSHLYTNSLKSLGMLNNMKLDTPVLEFKLQIFLKGLESVINEVPKKEKMNTIVKIMQITFEKLGYEVEPNEAYVLYQIRDLGRFRLKDDKLWKDLEKSWGEHPQFRFEKSDYKVILNGLKNIRFIDTRRGSITLGENIIIDE